MGRLHSKIFESIKKMYSSEDETICDILKQYCSKRITLKNLGVKPEFQLDNSFGDAIFTFSQIDGCESPLEKMNCLKLTIQSISTSVQEQSSKKSFFGFKKTGT